MKYFKIKEIGKIVSGSTPKTEVEEFWNGNISWVTPKEISQLDSPYLKETERKLTEEGFKSCSATILPKGSILFTSRAPIGLVAIADIEVCTNQGFKSIQLNKGFYPLYIYYLLKFNTRQLQNLGTGSTFMELSKSRFEQFEVPIPEFPEQIKIATVLNKAEALIKQRKENTDLLDAFLKATFFKLFGDPIRNEKNWERDALENLVAKDCPLTYGIVQPGDEFPNGVPIVRPVDLTKSHISRQGLKLIDPKISQKFQRTLLKGNEILMCVRGTTGVVSYATEELKGCNVTRGITPIWFDNTYEKLFAYFLFKSSGVQNEIAKYTYGATLKQINLSDLRKLNLIKPPIELQREFTSIALKCESLGLVYDESLKEIENLYASLSQRAFKGELDLTDVKIDESLLSNETQQLTEQPEALPQEIKDALAVATKISKQFEKVSDFAKAATKFTKYFETWDKINRSLTNIPQLPNTLLQAQENMLRIQKAFSAVTTVTKPKSQGKITWDRVSSEQFANWIKESFNGFHFTSEMLINFLTEEHVTFPDYYSSEELKKNPKANDADDFKSFIFAALNNRNPFLRLEQVFYNGEMDNINLTLRPEDFELIKAKSKAERTGVYLQIVE